MRGLLPNTREINIPNKLPVRQPIDADIDHNRSSLEHLK